MEIINILFAAVGITFGFGLAWVVLSGRSAELKAQISSLQEEKHQALSEQTELRERAIKAETALAHEQSKAEDQQKLLRAEFKQTADNLLEQITGKFSVQSEKKLGDLLNPMQQHLNEFKKLVVDSFTAQGKEQHTLKNEIEKIVLQADSLTQALRGDVKAQGNWGEIMLERILEESGLRRGEDYTLQGESMGLKGESGNHLKPDVIVNLPDNKHIIIDSKVSLTAYERYCAATDDAQRAAQAKEFIRSVKSHVAGLEGKRYQDIDRLGTPDFVVLFMPTEGAFSFAVQQDPELHSYAWGKKIALVSPTTLFATLRTIASLWSMERQNRNTAEIAKRGELMHKKFMGFLKDMQDIGKSLDAARSTYNQATSKLHTGPGNLVSDSKKLKELGVKSTKAIPEKFLEKDSEVA